jgi:hypothetical protein
MTDEEIVKEAVEKIMVYWPGISPNQSTLEDIILAAIKKSQEERRKGEASILGL